MAPSQKQMVIIWESLFDLLYNNDMLSVLIRIASTNEQFVYRRLVYYGSLAMAQSDRNIHWAHIGRPRMQSFIMWTTKPLIRLRGCAVWLSLRWARMSESTFSHVTIYFCYKAGKNRFNL